MGLGPYIDVVGALSSDDGGAVSHTDESLTMEDANTTEPDDDDEGGHDMGTCDEGGHDRGTCGGESMSDSDGEGGYRDGDGPWALMSDEDMAQAAQEAEWRAELAPIVETEVDSNSSCPWRFENSGNESYWRQNRHLDHEYGSPEDAYESD